MKGFEQSLSLVDADLRKLYSDPAFLDEVSVSYTSFVKSEARSCIEVKPYPLVLAANVALLSASTVATTIGQARDPAFGPYFHRVRQGASASVRYGIEASFFITAPISGDLALMRPFGLCLCRVGAAFAFTLNVRRQGTVSTSLFLCLCTWYTCQDCLLDHVQTLSAICLTDLWTSFAERLSTVSWPAKENWVRYPSCREHALADQLLGQYGWVDGGADGQAFGSPHNPARRLRGQLQGRIGHAGRLAAVEDREQEMADQMDGSLRCADEMHCSASQGVPLWLLVGTGVDVAIGLDFR
ncbi:hypothetical protein MRB53_034852 [Persea americana]|uniref:Uncharacterized protein n=1 Tax=Persea americana TaxID=3435 RepID=A0ACC2K323_PERAE|nr:hypothetical protein MRB53_034852 [Persea americana]